MSKVIKFGGDNLACIISRYIRRGDICIAYECSDEEYARVKGAELSDARYNVRYHKLASDNDAINFGGEYILGVGGDIADAVLSRTPNKKSVILLRPNIFSCINARFLRELGYRKSGKHSVDCRIIDESIIPSGDAQAEILGGITAAYQAAVDNLLQSYIKKVDFALTDSVLKLDDILSRKRLDYGELIDALALSSEIIDGAFSDLSGAAFIASDLIARETGMRRGDACLLSSTCYLYSAYSLIGKDCGLSLTAEKTAIAESIAAMSGIDKRAVISALGIIPASVIGRNDYIVKEYADELKAFIRDRFPLLTNVCKLWRRQKSDVGREVSRSITIKEIFKILSDATLIGNSYGILRHYKETGAV